MEREKKCKVPGCRGFSSELAWQQSSVSRCNAHYAREFPEHGEFFKKAQSKGGQASSKNFGTAQILDYLQSSEVVTADSLRQIPIRALNDYLEGAISRTIYRDILSAVKVYLRMDMIEIFKEQHEAKAQDREARQARSQKLQDMLQMPY